GGVADRRALRGGAVAGDPADPAGHLLGGPPVRADWRDRGRDRVPSPPAEPTRRPPPNYGTTELKIEADTPVVPQLGSGGARVGSGVVAGAAGGPYRSHIDGGH